MVQQLAMHHNFSPFEGNYTKQRVWSKLEMPGSGALLYSLKSDALVAELVHEVYDHHCLKYAT